VNSTLGPGAWSRNPGLLSPPGESNKTEKEDIPIKGKLKLEGGRKLYIIEREVSIYLDIGI
jgi:hypothetical protein